MVKQILFGVLVVILLASLIAAITNSVSESRNIVRVKLVGSPDDALMMNYENILISIKKDLGKKVNLEIIPVVNVSQAENKDEVKIEESAEFEEALRQHLIKKHYPQKFLAYLEAKNESSNDSASTTALNFAGFTKEEVENLNEKIKNLEDKDELTKLSKDLSYRFSQLFINDEEYYGGISKSALLADIVKPLVRKGSDHLPESVETSWFGGAINFKWPLSLTYQGYKEAYNDSHCVDKKDRDGYLLDGETKHARCIYAEPPAVNLTVTGEANELILNAFKRDFKGLKSNLLNKDSEEAKILNQKIAKAIDEYIAEQIKGIDIKDTQRKEKLTQLEELRKMLKNEPYYLFESDLAKDPDATKYFQSQFLITLKIDDQEKFLLVK
jgi:hypothetical protein